MGQASEKRAGGEEGKEVLRRGDSERDNSKTNNNQAISPLRPQTCSFAAGFLAAGFFAATFFTAAFFTAGFLAWIGGNWTVEKKKKGIHNFHSKRAEKKTASKPVRRFDVESPRTPSRSRCFLVTPSLAGCAPEAGRFGSSEKWRQKREAEPARDRRTWRLEAQNGRDTRRAFFCVCEKKPSLRGHNGRRQL